MAGTPFVVFDIETVVDPELPLPEATEADRLPAPPHHQVVAIGALWFTADHQPKRLGLIGEAKDEVGILNDFANMLGQFAPCLVSFNGRGFDMPVIAGRCFRHGLSLGGYYRNKDMRYRFSAEGHLDLMDFLADFGASRSSRLDVVAKLCGMPGKVGVDGKDVGPLVFAGRLKEVQDYCLCDVLQTAAVFLRTQLLRAVLSRELYQERMSALLALAEADERVRPVVERWDRSRLLLEG